MCTNYDLPSSKVSTKWCDKSTTCYVVKISNMPYRDGATWGPKGALAPASSTKKKARVGIKS